MEAEWPRALAQVELDVEQAGGPPPAQAAAVDLPVRLVQLIDSVPMEAIAEAGTTVSDRLRAGIERAGLTAPVQVAFRSAWLVLPAWPANTG